MFRVELIGEEIYDEFDQEGAGGTISSYVPTEHHPFSKLHGESLPDLPSTVAQPTETAKHIPTGSVLRPLSIKGFGFLRSRSEPPTPREKEQVPIVQPVPKLSPIGDNINEQATPETVIQTLEAMAATDEPQVAFQPAKTTSEDAPPAHSPKKRTLSNVGTASSVPHSSISAPGTRASSPAPSLEAILLDRKRRLAAAKEAGISTPVLPLASDVRSPAMLRIPTGSSKVGKFKSSPLTGGERSRVAAEQVRQDMMSPAYEGRIPDEKDDDAAHVKKEDDSGYL
jgi:metal transporter CNNM